MADEWSQYEVNNASSKGDEWEQYAVPTKSSKMNMLDTAADTYARAGMGAYDAMKWIPGVKQLANIVPGESADQMSAAYDKNANLGQQVVKGTGQALSTIPQLLPFIRGAESIPLIAKTGALGLGGLTAPVAGMAGFGATKAGVEGNNPVQGALEGAGQGLVYGAGGALGSKVAQMTLNPIARAIGGQMGANIVKAAPTVGSVAGMASSGATMAPEGQKASNAIIGGALGALSPVGVQTKQDVINHHADIYRDILNPAKGVIQKVEIKSGKDLNDAMKLAAQEKVIINSDVNNKLDTSQAVQQLQPKIQSLHDQLNQQLASDPHKQFDLEDLKADAKDMFNEKIKNAEDLKSAHAQVDNAIDAEIERNNNSPFVNGSQLNNIKQGFWSKGYDVLAPNANKNSRIIGNVAKRMIEDAYPDETVKSLNQSMGKYLDLQALLENAHGNIVQAGKIGKYAAGIVGMATGHATHIPGAEIVGAMAGSKLTQFINDPARITNAMARKMALHQMADKSPMSPPQGAKFIPGQMYKGLPNYTKDKMSIEYNPIPEYIKNRENNTEGNPIPEEHYNGGLTIFQPTNPGSRGLPSPLNKPYDPHGIFNTPTGEAVSSNPIPMRGAVQNTTQDLSVGPKTSPVNGPLQPNRRAQFDMSKGGTPTGASNQGDVEDADFNPLKNAVSPQKDPINQGIKALGLAGAIGAASMFNPLNAQAGQVKDAERLKLPANEYTKKEEGFQSHPYIDSKGYKTIGYGFKMDAVGKYLPKLVQEGKRPLTREEADQIYTKLYSNARRKAQDFVGDKWHDLNGNQQKAVVDLAYNMNHTLDNFKKMKKAIDDGDFNRASSEILNSAYAKQAPNRAKRNASLLTMK